MGELSCICSDAASYLEKLPRQEWVLYAMIDNQCMPGGWRTSNPSEHRNAETVVVRKQHLLYNIKHYIAHLAAVVSDFELEKNHVNFFGEADHITSFAREQLNSADKEKQSMSFKDYAFQKHKVVVQNAAMETVEVDVENRTCDCQGWQVRQSIHSF